MTDLLKVLMLSFSSTAGSTNIPKKTFDKLLFPLDQMDHLTKCEYMLKKNFFIDNKRWKKKIVHYNSQNPVL